MNKLYVLRSTFYVLLRKPVQLFRLALSRNKVRRKPIFNFQFSIFNCCLFLILGSWFLAPGSIPAQAKWGAWGEGVDEIDIVKLENYDRFYDVTISVDTVIYITDRALQRRFSQARIPYNNRQKYNFRADFRVFYLWKDNFVVRFVVTENEVISKKEAREKRSVNLFDAKPFAMRYDSRCLDSEELISSDNYNPDYFTPDYFHTKLGIEERDSLRLYNYFQMQILQVDSARYSAYCPPMYHIINPFLLPYSYREIREEWTAEDVIFNYIYNRLFVNNKALVREDEDRAWQNTDGVTVCYLIPETIPEPEAGETLTFKNCLKENSSVTVWQLNNEMYRINNTFPYIDRRNVVVSYNILYIPNKLYFTEPNFNFRIIKNDSR